MRKRRVPGLPSGGDCLNGRTRLGSEQNRKQNSLDATTVYVRRRDTQVKARDTSLPRPCASFARKHQRPTPRLQGIPEMTLTERKEQSSARVQPPSPTTHTILPSCYEALSRCCTDHFGNIINFSPSRTFMAGFYLTVSSLNLLSPTVGHPGSF